jgi:hypothetical protein
LAKGNLIPIGCQSSLPARLQETGQTQSCAN